jgi:hypothetical protein
MQMNPADQLNADLEAMKSLLSCGHPFTIESPGSSQWSEQGQSFARNRFYIVELFTSKETDHATAAGTGVTLADAIKRVLEATK